MSGNFVCQIWNPLKKAILYNGKSFNYSFFKTNDLIVEIKHNEFDTYHIYSSTKMYPASIQLSTHDIYKDSYLLLTLDREIAEPLIKKNLL